ncbi:MAG: molecular chaperone Hsp20 [Phycisphaerales bacterium]|nr:MAG: molecular chaperone Hsp20 [Phycisphaerales bacterium]
MQIIPWFGNRSGGLARRREPHAGDIRSLQRDIDRLFEQFWTNPFALATGEAFERAMPMPSIDIKNKKNEIVISAELPGMSADQVNIEVNDRILTISGEKTEEQEKEEGDAYYSERRFGRFSRSIELPPEADVDSIEAKEKNGVLTIRIKKTKPTTSKKISVKSEG